MQLWSQLLAAALLMVVMSVLHAAGIVAITRLLKLEEQRLKAHRLGASAFLLLTAVALLLFVLHALEIAIFALFYWLVGAVEGLEEALFYSASSYSTLGHTIEVFPMQWRLLGAIEGLIGFLLLGWSTAVFVADMNKLLCEKKL